MKLNTSISTLTFPADVQCMFFQGDFVVLPVGFSFDDTQTFHTILAVLQHYELQHIEYHICKSYPHSRTVSTPQLLALVEVGET